LRRDFFEMRASSGTSHTVKHLLEGMTSHTFTTCFSSGEVDCPERGESSVEFQPSLSVFTTHMFEYSPWIHYETLSVTFCVFLNDFP
jgi:hypothetical protein